MLKVIRFDGTIVVDLDRFHKFNVENVIQEAIDDNGTNLQYTSHNIIKPSDIPHGWLGARPYGDRSDDKNCQEIFEEEILPTLPTEDPNQNKFEFFNGIKPKFD